MLEQINLTARRDVPAGVLAYAEQRALEIGITIAGGADVILLDEPTAGMSRSETEHVVQLIRQVTAGKTLLMVEHDMSVVFDLADKIAVLVYGEVIAYDAPARIRANAAVQEAYLGQPDGAPDADVRDLHAFYGKSHILHGVDLDVGEGEIVSLLGRNGVGRSTTIKAIMGLVPPVGLRPLPRRGALRAAALPHRPAGPGLRAREPRHLPHPDRAPEPAARA